jgi:hypothetical protein
MSQLSPKLWNTDADRDRVDNMRKFRQRLHDHCHELKYIGVEVATTIVFLYWLIRTVYHELGF